jgi:hypothetical protein
LAGIGIGWRLARIHPVVKDQQEQELAKQNQALQVTNRREDDITSSIVLRALRCVEEGRTNQAEQVVLQTVVGYYCIHQDWGGGNTDVLAQIEVAVKKYPILAAELAKERETQRLTE